MDDVQEAKPRRRSRSRSSSRKKHSSWSEYFRGREFGRLVFYAMCLLGVAYTGFKLYTTRLASIYYSEVTIDLPDSEVRYMLGAPDRLEQNGLLYRYDEGGRVISTKQSPDKLLTAVSCTAPRLNSAHCETVLGLGIGSTEADVVVRLGAPDRVTYDGNDKIIHYDGMGLSFFLRKYEVYAIELHKGGSLLGYLPRVLWRMVP
ncbi:MAG: hypothetical protein ABIT16_03635 [Croceibacterium sp.]